MQSETERSRQTVQDTSIPVEQQQQQLGNRRLSGTIMEISLSLTDAHTHTHSHPRTQDCPERAGDFSFNTTRMRPRTDCQKS
jgi:hypothetical protein